MIWKKIVLAAVLTIAAFVLQCTVLKWVSIGGATPNIIIFFLFLLGFIGGKKAGMFVGLASGLLIDCFYSDVFGANALILLFIGYFSAVFGRIFYDDDIKIPILLAVAMDFLYNFIYYICWFLFKGQIDFGFFFSKVVLPEIIYTFVIIAIFYIPLSKLIKHFYYEKEVQIDFTITKNE